MLYLTIKSFCCQKTVVARLGTERSEGLYLWYCPLLSEVLAAANAAFSQQNSGAVRYHNRIDFRLVTRLLCKLLCNGIYEIVDFTWVNTHKYRAVKIGDIFYDYDDYYNNRYDQISDLDEFRQQMYNTDRVY